MSEAIRERSVVARGLRLGMLEAGPDDGPLALALHGFPDTAWTWRHLLPALAEDGFHAVAPFMRGYAPSEVAADGSYQAGALVADAIALHEALGGDERAVLIGHDWGATAAYGAAAQAPERWSRLVTSAVPPLSVFLRGLFDFDQLRRSWYMFFFQLPVAEGVVAVDDMAFLARLWADWSPGYDAATDLAHVRDSLRSPANLGAALAYYRAAFDSSGHDPLLAAEQAATGAAIPVPWLYIHGLDDGCVGADLVSDGLLAATPAGSRVIVVEGAGHFSHLEQPDVVNAHIREFVTGAQSQPASS